MANNILGRNTRHQMLKAAVAIILRDDWGMERPGDPWQAAMVADRFAVGGQP